MIKLIACIDKYNSIGINNDLIYKYKNDLTIFKQKTLNNIIVMGRKTFESIGNNPLCNRENIIISKTLKQPDSNNYKVYSNINNVLSIKSNKEIFIIGGKEIFEFFMPYYDELHLTIIKDSYTKIYDLNSSIKLNLNLSNFEIISCQTYPQFHINIYKRLR